METIFAQTVQLALIVGPKQCGKTTLAFKMAYDAAASGQSPLYICQSMHSPTYCSISEQDALSQKAYYEPEVLDRIRMKFAESVAELIILISSLHLFNPRPSLVVIDNFIEMNKRDDFGLEALLFGSAIIQNAALLLIGKDGDTNPVTKFLTVLSSTDAHLISALKRYYHILCHIERTSTGRTVVKVNTISLPLSTTLPGLTLPDSTEKSFYFTV